jgi:arsenate reductase
MKSNQTHNDKSKVLILCTGNSCRSQMAEALINNRLPDDWVAFSAGTDPAGYVHPLALEVLKEIGISHHGTSKHIDQLPTKDFDLVITVCDDAAENCPIWLGEGKRIHIGFQDPAAAQGTDDEVIGIFRTVRDQISDRLIYFVKSYPDSLDLKENSIE